MDKKALRAFVVFIVVSCLVIPGMYILSILSPDKTFKIFCPQKENISNINKTLVENSMRNNGSGLTIPSDEKQIKIIELNNNFTSAEKVEIVDFNTASGDLVNEVAAIPSNAGNKRNGLSGSILTQADSSADKYNLADIFVLDNLFKFDSGNLLQDSTTTIGDLFILNRLFNEDEFNSSNNQYKLGDLFVLDKLFDESACTGTGTTISDIFILDRLFNH